MKTMVCFRTADGSFALPVENTLAVRKLDGLIRLPTPRADVIGVIFGDPPLSVIAPLGAGGEHLLVVSSGDVCFGLHVLEVIGVRRFDDSQIGPPPRGQESGFISGTLADADELMLIADPDALAARL